MCVMRPLFSDRIAFLQHEVRHAVGHALERLFEDTLGTRHTNSQRYQKQQNNVGKRNSRHKNKIKNGEIEGFNVGMNIGLCAGQTIMWPHIHFIPRKDKDAKHIGGMRHAHPGADHKGYY